jgi:hypothetical protein
MDALTVMIMSQANTHSLVPMWVNVAASIQMNATSTSGVSQGGYKELHLRLRDSVPSAHAWSKVT